MALVVLRCVFVMVAAGLGVRLINSGDLGTDPAWLPWVIFVGLMLLSAGVILADALVPRKRLDTISAVYFGLIIGLFLTYVLRLALSPVLPESDPWSQWAQLVLGMVVCYTCISLLIQTKDDFRFIIPYVEFSRQLKGLRALLLDTSVIIDGRIADILEAQVLDNQIIIPDFVISELQSIADSSDRLRRGRGRRGLDILQRLRTNPDLDVQIYDRDPPDLAGHPVDLKLVLLAKQLEGKVVTNDYNLNKVSKLHDVEVINVNDVANALKPVFVPGEEISVRLIKPGEEAGQGVGYLEDGTMVVVEGGRDHLNRTVKIAVTSVLQTSAGRMVFGKYEAPVPA